LQIEKIALGKSMEEARKRAEKIKYGYKIDGNKLVLDNYLISQVASKFRNQKVEMFLYLPLGTQFQADASVQVYDESEDGSTANTFTRQIDGWLLAAAFGAQDYESAPNMDAANTVKIISGQVLKGNVAAISFLGTLAIGLTGDVDVIRDPKKVIKIATICAELGFPRLKSAMNVGAVTPPAVTLASFMADLAEDFPIK
jgi:hypothetical protein